MLSSLLLFVSQAVQIKEKAFMVFCIIAYIFTFFEEWHAPLLLAFSSALPYRLDISHLTLRPLSMLSNKAFHPLRADRLPMPR